MKSYAGSLIGRYPRALSFFLGIPFLLSGCAPSLDAIGDFCDSKMLDKKVYKVYPGSTVIHGDFDGDGNNDFKIRTDERDVVVLYGDGNGGYRLKGWRGGKLSADIIRELAEHAAQDTTGKGGPIIKEPEHEYKVPILPPSPLPEHKNSPSDATCI